MISASMPITDDPRSKRLTHLKGDLNQLWLMARQLERDRAPSHSTTKLHEDAGLRSTQQGA